MAVCQIVEVRAYISCCVFFSAKIEVQKIIRVFLFFFFFFGHIGTLVLKLSVSKNLCVLQKQMDVSEVFV